MLRWSKQEVSLTSVKLCANSHQLQPSHCCLLHLKRTWNIPTSSFIIQHCLQNNLTILLFITNHKYLSYGAYSCPLWREKQGKFICKISWNSAIWHNFILYFILKHLKQELLRNIFWSPELAKFSSDIGLWYITKWLLSQRKKTVLSAWLVCLLKMWCAINNAS